VFFHTIQFLTFLALLFFFKSSGILQVVHHAYGGLHWSEIPDRFYSEVDKMASYNQDLLCITFLDSTILEVWAHVASNKLPQLVKNKFVHIPTAPRPEPPTIDAIVTELKARLQPLDFGKRKAPESQTQRRKRFQGEKTLAQVISESFVWSKSKVKAF